MINYYSCYNFSCTPIIIIIKTTYANLPNPHEVDFFDSIHSYCDITEWYNKNKIVDWRLKFLKNGNLLSEKKSKLSIIFLTDTHLRGLSHKVSVIVLKYDKIILAILTSLLEEKGRSKFNLRDNS